VLIVVDPPSLDLLFCVFHRDKPMLLQALLPKPSVETLDVRILNGLSRPDEVQLHPVPVCPFVHGPTGELRPVVRPEMRRNAPADEQVRLGVQNIVGVDSLTTPYFCRSHNLQDTAIRTMRSSLCGNRCRTRNCRYVREGGALVGYLGSPRRRNVNQSAKQKPA
jgi:hypothetical protein